MFGLVLYLFFFFKKKTAYEIRPCDWSSDVCSSDLGRARPSGVVLSWTGEWAGGGHIREGGHMSDHSEEVYGPDRAERLLAMLRALAERIRTLDRTGGLLERAPELQKLLGNARSELFHYEVRVTYDTPEIAERRRIVDEAERRARDAAAGFEDDEDDEPWRRGRDE